MGAAARGDGRHRPRVRPARHADAGRSRSRSASPGRCSATTARRPAATASSGSGTSRRSAIRGRVWTRSWSSSALTFYREVGPARRRGAPQLDRRPGLPARLPRRAGRLLPRADSTSCPRPSAADSRRTRSASSTRRHPSMAAVNAKAPKLIDRLCDACGAHFAAVREHLDADRRHLPAGAGSRARSRLLHADGLRVLPARAPKASSRRWAAAAATTVWSNCWAASRRPGSGSRSGWTG